MKTVFLNQTVIVDIDHKDKFPIESTSFETDRLIIKCLGYFLNLSDCLKRHSCSNFVDLCLMLYEKHIPLPKVLNGAYISIIYDKKSHDLYVFNDLLSKQSLFYYYDYKSSKLLISDSFFKAFEMVKDNHLSYSIDELGLKMMLSHGIFYDDLTYINEIKFLRPFEYLVLSIGKLETKIIERPKIINPSFEEAAEQIHQKFQEAVELQYKKNEEGGFPQVIALSGGMDSRSTFLYALAIGYKQQICYNFAESTSADFDIARDLAVKNDCEFFYHALDRGNHLMEREEMCESNEAQAVYSGPSGTYNCLRFFGTERMGIVHTGLGGGEIMGDMRIPDNPTITEKFVNSLKYRMGKGKKESSWESFFNSLNCTENEISRLHEMRDKYSDFNEFQSLNDIRRCLNSQKMARSFGIDYVSPFLYEDFFCYMLQIPYSLSKDRKLYLYWQKKYNPEQFKTPSTFQMGCRPGNKLGYYVKRFYKFIVNKMGGKTRYDMNPEEFWLSNNPKIVKTQNKLYCSDMDVIRNRVDVSLFNHLERCWSTGMASRSNILTVTWALTKIVEN